MVGWSRSWKHVGRIACGGTHWRRGAVFARVEASRTEGGDVMSVPAGQVFRPTDTVAYQDGSVVSRQLMKLPSGSVTVFAFDAGEGLSEHTTPHDALVSVLDGRAEITVLGEVHEVGTGEAILLPGGEPHALAARERFIMSLVMLRKTNPSTSEHS
jgi:quercetin dioxygenase-like cupin family protein